MPKVRVSCSEVVRYGCTIEMSDEDVAAYEAAQGEEDYTWFAAFAGRFIDRVNHLSDSEGFEDVGVTVLRASYG
jgi:hypothetical protein